MTARRDVTLFGDEKSISSSTAGDSGGTHGGGSPAATLTNDKLRGASDGISAPDGGTGAAP